MKNNAAVKFQELELNVIQAAMIANLMQQHQHTQHITYQDTCKIANRISEMVVKNIAKVFQNDNTFFFVKFEKSFGLKGGSKSNELFFTADKLELANNCELRVLTVKAVLWNRRQLILNLNK